MSANTEPPVTGRREWNKQQKRDRIVTAARALFYAQGYKKTTTQQIARAAKVASGTLFLYAKTKEDLLLLVFYDEFMAIINAISVSADLCDLVRGVLSLAYAGAGETGARRAAGAG